MFEPAKSELVRSGPELTGLGRTDLEPVDLGRTDLEKFAPRHSAPAAPVAWRSHRQACHRLADFHSSESPAPRTNRPAISSPTVPPL